MRSELELLRAEPRSAIARAGAYVPPRTVSRAAAASGSEFLIYYSLPVQLSVPRSKQAVLNSIAGGKVTAGFVFPAVLVPASLCLHSGHAHFATFGSRLFKFGQLLKFSNFQSILVRPSTLSSLRSRPFCHFWLSAIQIWPAVGIFKFSVIFCVSSHSVFTPVAPGFDVARIL